MIHRRRLFELAEMLEAIVMEDIREHRVGDGTTKLLAAANEMRRRQDPVELEALIVQSVSDGMSLREASRHYGIPVGRIRGAVKRAAG